MDEDGRPVIAARELSHPRVRLLYGDLATRAEAERMPYRTYLGTPGPT